jgi:hypothetical protein
MTTETPRCRYSPYEYYNVVHYADCLQIDSSVSITVFWDVTPCVLTCAHKHFRGKLTLNFYHNYGGPLSFRNIGTHIPDYMVSVRNFVVSAVGRTLIQL